MVPLEEMFLKHCSNQNNKKKIKIQKEVKYYRNC